MFFKNIWTQKLATFLLVAGLAAGYSSCQLDDIPDPNNPSLSVIESNATLGEIQNLVDGIQAWMRDRLGTYLDGVGVIGREYYRFSGSDPRFTSDLLGKGNAVLDDNTFYTTRPFQSRYRVVKNCNILLTAIENTSAPISAAEKSAAQGFAKTIMAHELLMVLNQQYKNGIRVDVADPDNLGPFLSLEASLDAIASLLDEAAADLQAGGDRFPFSLSSGFAGYDTPASFLKFNRALAARVDLYRQDWNGALDALNGSFFDLGGDFYDGVYYIFSTAGGDQLNEMWFPLNSTGELRVAHPSYVTDIEAGDDRISKVTQRADEAFQDGLSSQWDVTVYHSNTDPMPIIRNEELILIFAEASAQTGKTDDAVMAINTIRNAHGLADYSGGTSTEELIDEILKQRRFSLFGEGHRWIDMRRYGRLGELPIDRPDDDVWEQFPRPASEN